MTILAIETSCDETSIAIVQGDRLIASQTYSQIKHHKVWQGVHPSVARRAHADRLPILLDQVLQASNYSLPFQRGGLGRGSEQPKTSNLPARRNGGKPKTCITAIAVTVGPGLPPALEEGIKFAKALAIKHHLPLIPVNHLEGHLASIFLKRKTGTPFTSQPSTLNPQPSQLLNLIVSGGHTELVLTQTTPSENPVSDPRPFPRGGLGRGSAQPDLKATSYKLPATHTLIGQTLDDAAGEVLDKVGRELGLGYPAGPVIERLAKNGNPHAFKFPLPMKNTPQNNLDFSFSGLKTKAIQMLHGSHAINSYTKRPSPLTPDSRLLTPDFAASFQQAVIDAILFKVRRALRIYSSPFQRGRLGGGSAQPDIKATSYKLPAILTLSGGVSANLELRKQLRKLMRQHNGILLASHNKFTGDNAAMIGLAAQWAAARGEIATTPEEITTIDRQPNLNFKQQNQS